MPFKAAMGMLALLGLLVGTGCGAAVGRRGVVTDTTVASVSVFYATDRDAQSRQPDHVRYSWRRAYVPDGQPYELGVCKVDIRRERNHDKVGPLPRYTFEVVNLVSTTPLERDRFYERVRERIWYAGSNDTFVFIHGFNNTFEDAAKRTAEIWYDIGFEGPPIMFSWPSRGGSFWRGVLGYFADSETLKWSAEHLKDFLIELSEETRADRMFADEPARIHLVAHSMGCRALARALMLVADELGQADPPIFCDVILAAPDIDRDLFRDVIVLKLIRARLAEHYTVYASSSDSVIKTSAKLQVYPRAGDAGEGLVAVDHESFTTVDASAITSGWIGLRHDYFFTEPRVTRDLIEILQKGNRDPSGLGRFLQPHDQAPNVWVMYPDEPEGPPVLTEVN